LGKRQAKLALLITDALLNGFFNRKDIIRLAFLRNRCILTTFALYSSTIPFIFRYFSLFFSFKKLVFPSIIETVGIATGLASVLFATRAHLATWHFGILSQLAYFVVFYQAQLYSDMFLQIFYTILCVYGIVNWGKAADLPISTLSSRAVLRDSCLILLASLIWGTLMRYLPVLLPALFPEPAAMPYLDGAIGVLSVFATIYQAKKRIETWWLWLIVDAVAVPLYWYRELSFTAILYAVFGAMAFLGYLNWRKLQKKQDLFVNFSKS
jgi:nicotinamide mononucleotide transporter